MSLTNKLTAAQLQQVATRVDYYCKIEEQFLANGISVFELKKPKSPKAYYFDTYEFARYFSGDFKINTAFGDVTWVPEKPSIVKSRPVNNINQNSVLLNLDKTRHFVFVKDDGDFSKKKNQMLGRAAVFQEHRYRFFDMHFGNALCNLGQVNKEGGNIEWLKPKMSLQEHLDYKFILSLEGNDVATNLKWIMSSNSIAVMPKPKFETWFMEGKLKGGVHYIEIREDYSDLNEKLTFYIENEAECLKILENQHRHVEQFNNKDIEELCALLVWEKYFIKSGQYLGS